jgi:hypothetical protein
MLPRVPVVRPRGQPLDRRHPIRPDFPHLAEQRMGSRRAVRRLAQRPQVPQGWPRLGASRHVSSYMTRHDTAPTGHLEARRRARAAHPPDRFHTRRTPLPGVRDPVPACPSPGHQDARRAPMEWLGDHLAASRPQAILPQSEVPPPHLHRATAQHCGAGEWPVLWPWEWHSAPALRPVAAWCCRELQEACSSDGFPTATAVIPSWA